MEGTEEQDLPETPTAPPTFRRAGERARRRSSERRDLPWNVLTVLTWLVTACTLMAFISIYANPSSPLNPFRPAAAPTLVSVVSIPTMTPSTMPDQATLEQLSRETWTATPASTMTPTRTATVTPSPVPTETATPGPSPTPTIRSLYPFVQRGDIKVIDASTFPDHETCKLWVAGQAYDLQGAPMVGITVMLGGVIERKSLYQLSLTGTALQYGQAGYEFTVADKPAKAKQTVWVQLFDQAMIPLSGKVYFDTYDDCKQNLILVNFRQIR